MTMYYAPDALAKAQSLLSALADIEFRYEAALVRARNWPGRRDVKERCINRLLASRERDRAPIHEQIARLQTRTIARAAH